MLVKNLWIVFLSALFFGGIVVWQLNHLREMKALKDENFKEQAKVELQNLGTSLKSVTAWGKEGFDIIDLTPEKASSFQCTLDSLLQIYFSDIQVNWGIVDADHDSVVLTNVQSQEYILLLESDVRTCLSCLVTISFVDREGGMIIEHSVAQIRAMFNNENDDILFLVISRKGNEALTWLDYLVFVFVIGLSILFAVSIYLNSRQKKLIEQKNEFINHLSHQFKTPLASIRLGINMLLEAEQFKDNKMLKVIHLESNRLEKHIQTVLQWVRSGAQGLQLNVKPCNVVAITQNAIIQMGPIFKQEEVSIKTDFKVEHITAFVDEYHLTLVYFNLWENAIKHNPKPLELSVTIKKQGSFVWIEHKDNGEGFDVSKSVKYSAFTGLGLLYVKKVMKAHGGGIEVMAEKGKGTKILLKLPLTK